MGNQPSKEDLPGVQNPESKDPAQKPRPRDSLSTLTAPRSAADPPTTSLESAQGQHASASSTQPQATTQLKSQASTHTRQRSSTLNTAPGKMSEKSIPEHGSLPTRLVTQSAQSQHAQPVQMTPESAAQQTISPRSASGSGSAGYYVQNQGFQRAPRVPIPIEEEVHSPGSPIMAPVDRNEIQDAIGVDRTRSMLSNTTLDDEDEDWGEDLAGSPGSSALYQIPIEWRGQAEKIYVASSFDNWGRKIRMTRASQIKDSDDWLYKAHLHLGPGIHHIIFLIDGNMAVSQDLPTTVDFTTSLVNYIEVIATNEGQPPTDLSLDNDGYTPQEQEYRNMRSTTQSKSRTGDDPELERQPFKQVAKNKVEAKYHQEIPQFFEDLDAPEDTTRFLRSSSVLATQPPPPSLPMIMSKSILNGTTPLKDDASVLQMPNHTIINHLATSSIKNNILATSATTRYKRKFLTTIIFKPTSERDD